MHFFFLFERYAFCKLYNLVISTYAAKVGFGKIITVVMKKEKW